MHSVAVIGISILFTEPRYIQPSCIHQPKPDWKSGSFSEHRLNRLLSAGAQMEFIIIKVELTEVTHMGITWRSQESISVYWISKEPAFFFFFGAGFYYIFLEVKFDQHHITDGHNEVMWIYTLKKYLNVFTRLLWASPSLFIQGLPHH